MKKNTTPVVDDIGELNFTGNVIPHSWYENIKLPSGKTDTVAIILLSDIIYWYRPTIKRDEATGAIVAIEKKFASDMLQKQYETWGNLFGFTKRQTRDATTRLVKAGLIKRVFRQVTPPNGITLSNVMFIEPVIERIKEITFQARMAIDNKGGYDVLTSHVSPFNAAPTAPDVDTYTEITTEITTENHPGPPVINTPGVEVEKNDDNEQNKPKSLSNPDSKFLPTMDSKTLNELTEYMANIRKRLLEYDDIEEPSIRNQRVVEVPLFRKWFDAGIPCACVLAGIDTTMARHKKGKKVQSVKYFENEVQKAYAEYNVALSEDKAIKDSTSNSLSRMKELLYGKQAGSV